LKQARAYVFQAEALSGNHAAADKVRQELTRNGFVLEKDRRQLQSFTQALAQRAAGYEYLVAGEKAE